ncbi:hypothetical protein IR009_23200 [Pseudomonas putida]|uniref:hypothetical protein n=1 Tax=Pseudomonas putida TaxID=303 RepID=UPI0018A93271|nr:hypothetical protein [Pseudomonas putida]MBF8768104.1 hypothetical protein [Pseudomonas putida]
MKYIITLLFLAMLSTACTAERDDAQQSSPRHTDLISKATSHIQRQQYQQALSDVDAALSLAPHNSEYRFLHCLLKERLGQPLSLAKDCYAQLVEQFSRGGDAQCDKNMNCVIADLMAEGPQAEARRQRFLALPASAAESEVRHYVLDGFDRDQYLNTILP